MENHELYHYGIKGMRWGIRRTQAQLGHRTTSQNKKKQSVIEKWKKQRQSKKETEREEARKEALRNKPVSKMTDSELNERISRLTKERQVLQLQKDVSALTPQKVSAGKSFLSKFGNEAVVPALTTAGKNVLTKWLEKTAGGKLGLDAAESYTSKLKKAAEEAGYKKTIAEAEMTERRNKQQKEEAAKNERESAKAEKEAAKRAKESAKSGKDYTSDSSSKTINNVSSSASSGRSFTNDSGLLSLPASTYTAENVNIPRKPTEKW